MLRRTTPKALALALLGAALLGACHSPIGAERPANTFRATEGAFDIEESWDDAFLRHDVEPTGARVRRVEGFLVLDLDLRNHRPHPTRFEVRIDWFDPMGAMVGGPTPWRPLSLPAEGVQHLTSTAPTTACNTWQLSLRSPHESE